jgi:protein gp37
MVETIRYAATRTYWPSCDFQSLYSNQFFGFTAENQEWYDRRFKDVMDGRWPQWANLWLSAEPLLGPIELTPLDLAIGGIGVPRIFQWIVVGCESGQNRRPCKIEWVESIVEQCLAANVPVFVKQICLPNGKFTNKIEEFPEHLRIRQVPWATKGETK